MQPNLGLLWVFQYLAYEYDNKIVFHYMFTAVAGLQGVVMLGSHLFRAWEWRKKEKASNPSTRQITPVEDSINRKAFLYEGATIRIPKVRVRNH